MAVSLHFPKDACVFFWLSLDDSAAQASEGEGGKAGPQGEDHLQDLGSRPGPGGSHQATEPGEEGPRQEEGEPLDRPSSPHEEGRGKIDFFRFETVVANF